MVTLIFVFFRFWKCDVTKKDNDEFDYAWKEWEMMNKDQESAIDIPGMIRLHLNTNIK